MTGTGGGSTPLPAAPHTVNRGDVLLSALQASRAYRCTAAAAGAGTSVFDEAHSVVDALTGSGVLMFSSMQGRGDTILAVMEAIVAGPATGPAGASAELRAAVTVASALIDSGGATLGARR